VIFFIIGFLIGAGLTVWFLFGNRLKWGIPAQVRLDDDFTTLNPFWTKLCIGPAEISLLPEEGTAGGTFARLVLKSALAGQLALAQIDDYLYRPFADYPWRPPLYAEMRLRLSHDHGPGTVGLWFWNNGMGLGAELADFRPPRWLGFYRISPAATLAYTDIQSRFRASVLNGTWPGLFSMFGAPLLPPLQAVEKPLDGLKDWTEWHTYAIDWQLDSVRLFIDGQTILECTAKIKGPLALVCWYDNNQPQVRRRYFDIKNEAMAAPAWLDIDYVRVETSLTATA
jgi:hypothetical protein